MESIQLLVDSLMNRLGLDSMGQEVVIQQPMGALAQLCMWQLVVGYKLRELEDNYEELLDKSENCFGKQDEDAQKKATAAMAAKIRRASLSKERQKLKKRNLSPKDCIEELARARARLRNLGKRP